MTSACQRRAGPPLDEGGAAHSLGSTSCSSSRRLSQPTAGGMPPMSGWKRANPNVALGGELGDELVGRDDLVLPGGPQRLDVGGLLVAGVGTRGGRPGAVGVGLVEHVRTDGRPTPRRRRWRGTWRSCRHRGTRPGSEPPRAIRSDPVGLPHVVGRRPEAHLRGERRGERPPRCCRPWPASGRAGSVTAWASPARCGRGARRAPRSTPGAAPRSPRWSAPPARPSARRTWRTRRRRTRWRSRARGDRPRRGRRPPRPRPAGAGRGRRRPWPPPGSRSARCAPPPPPPWAAGWGGSRRATRGAPRASATRTRSGRPTPPCPAPPRTARPGARRRTRGPAGRTGSRSTPWPQVGTGSVDAQRSLGGRGVHRSGRVGPWHPASHRCPSTGETRAPRSCSRRCADPTAPSSTSSPRWPGTRSCSSGGRPSAARCSTAGGCRHGHASSSSCAPATCAERTTSGASTSRSAGRPG